MASIDPFPGLSVYAASKVGLNMFTTCTAKEGAELGVRAVSIALGAVETPMLRGLFDESQLPREKALDPAEVAALIAECVTGKRAFEPGELLTFTVEQRP
jgi:NAD(P)-dependent dehydrogenase (short-subunit alcohol dehydrogenase family)